MGFVLFLISFILIVAFAPVGIAFTVLKSGILFNKRYINEYWTKLAVSLDQFGGVVMSGLFNLILISSDLNRFGNPDETISSVIGKNKKAGTLTGLGKGLDYLLEIFEKDHSIKSIEADE